MIEPTAQILDRNKNWQPVGLSRYPIFALTDRLVLILSKYNSAEDGLDGDILMAKVWNQARETLHYETQQLPLHLSMNILEAFGIIHKTRVLEENRLVQQLTSMMSQANGREYEPPKTDGYYITIQGIMMYAAYMKDAKVIEDSKEFVDTVTIIGKPLAL